MSKKLHFWSSVKFPSALSLSVAHNEDLIRLIQVKIYKLSVNIEEVNGVKN